MSGGPLNPDEFDDVDELYRRVSAQDQGGPSESVRRAVLEHATQLAAERAAARPAAADPTATERARSNVVSLGATKPRARRQTWWRPAAFGTLAAASLAGLLIAPQFLPPRVADRSASAPTSVRQPTPTAQPPTTPTPPAPGPTVPEPTAAAQPAPAYSGAPAAERNLAKMQAAPAAPSKSAAQDELQVEDKASEQGQLNEQVATAGRSVAADAKVASNVQGAAADSSEVQIEARRARSQAASGAASSAPAPAPAPASASAPALQSTTPMMAAALVDPAVELRHAAGSGDMPALRAALERRPVIDARDANGRTALMLAALYGRAEAVDVLLAAGADPNAADARGVTPLQAALNGGHADIAAALRRAGAR